MSDLAVRVLRAEVERLDARSNELAEEADDYSWLAAQVSRDAAEIRRAIALVTAEPRAVTSPAYEVPDDDTPEEFWFPAQETELPFPPYPGEASPLETSASWGGPLQG